MHVAFGRHCTRDYNERRQESGIACGPYSIRYYTRAASRLYYIYTHLLELAHNFEAELFAEDAAQRLVYQPEALRRVHLVWVQLRQLFCLNCVSSLTQVNCVSSLTLLLANTVLALSLKLFHSSSASSLWSLCLPSVSLNTPQSPSTPLILPQTPSISHTYVADIAQVQGMKPVDWPTVDSPTRSYIRQQIVARRGFLVEQEARLSCSTSR